jgi:cobalt-precorrin 5A hydrolase
MDVGKTLMIVAGIGCRRGVTAEEVEAALSAAIEAALQRGALGGLNSSEGSPAATDLTRPDGLAPPDNAEFPSELTLGRIATAASKGQEPGINVAAAARGIPLVLVAQADLEANNSKTSTRSSNSMRTMNVYSVSETAALAAAGEGSRLLGPRVAVGPVTCALAVAPYVTDAARFTAAAEPSAAAGSGVAAGITGRTGRTTVHRDSEATDTRRRAKGTHLP